MLNKNKRTKKEKEQQFFTPEIVGLPDMLFVAGPGTLAPVQCHTSPPAPECIESINVIKEARKVLGFSPLTIDHIEKVLED